MKGSCSSFTDKNGGGSLGDNSINRDVRFKHGICNLKNLQKLQLYESNFYGDLSCLGNLTSLKYLDLSHNNFTGVLPSIENLTSLEHLDLSDNSFKGRISLSSSLASLSKLKYLQLSRNWLEVQTEDSQWKPSFQLQFLGLASCSLNKPSGTFPKFLFHQYNLSGIDLSYNNLMGGFPTFLLDNNTHLTALYLMNNHLTGFLHFPRHTIFSSLYGLSISRNYFYGQLPNNFGYIFPNVGYLNMSWNHFEGHIPTSVGLMRSLGVLDLSNNNFSGELPRKILNIEQLKFLVLSNNNLRGEIVPDYMNLPNLGWLDLSSNSFTGTINKALLKSYYFLIYLDISLNRVTGQLPGWIESFIRLQSLSVSQNFLQGQIPLEICHLVYLNYLDLSLNNFTGTIPSCSNYTSLYYLHLHQNSLTGEIPNGYSNCTSLEALDLRGNKLSGMIPFWISNLANLIFLLLGGNDMRGHIPKELCELGHLNILDLSHNKFSGEIPTCIGNNSFGLISKEDYLNRVLNGITIAEEFLNFPFYPIDSEVKFLAKNQDLYYKEGSLHIFSGLDLSCNNFFGVIPSELGFLTHIYSLNLSHNFLSGPIPQNLSNLKQIESLDLSFNNLSGNIPSGLVDLNFLEVLNVSYNNLTGKVPDIGQFSSFDKNSYLGNMGLCGSTMDKPCDPKNNSSMNSGGDGGEGEDRSGVVDMVEFFWSFGMSCVVMFFSTQVILYVNSQWREAWFRFVDWHILWWFQV